MGNAHGQAIKLSYFDIEGVAEMIRLALKVQGIAFEDERVDFSDWTDHVKAKTKYGQLPLLRVNDEPVLAQSGAILRLVARMDGPIPMDLYPADTEKMVRIEECLGLAADLDKSLAPSMYMNMQSSKYGHPDCFGETDAGKDIIKGLREKWLAEDFPRFMGHYTKLLSAHDGTYFAGHDMTISDLAILPQLRKFERGLLDHIPTDVLDAYPIVNAWKNRMENNPAIFAHYYSADAGERTERTARERRVMSAHKHGAEEKAADALAGCPAGTAQRV